MSKKNKNLKEKRDESTKSHEIPESFSNKTIKKADSIYLISVSQNFKLKNV